jgi:flagellar protein FliO/FliZ
VPLEPDSLTTLTLTLGAIVLILAGVLWFVRRMQPGATRGGSGRGGPDCTVLRSLPLGPRERLVVVKVGNRHLVVGVGSASVSLLCELDEAPSLAEKPRFGDNVRDAVERWRAS